MSNANKVSTSESVGKSFAELPRVRREVYGQGFNEREFVRAQEAAPLLVQAGVPTDEWPRLYWRDRADEDDQLFRMSSEHPDGSLGRSLGENREAIVERLANGEPNACAVDVTVGTRPSNAPSALYGGNRQWLYTAHIELFWLADHVRARLGTHPASTAKAVPDPLRASAANTIEQFNHQTSAEYAAFHTGLVERRVLDSYRAGRSSQTGLEGHAAGTDSGATGVVEPAQTRETGAEKPREQRQLWWSDAVDELRKLGGGATYKDLFAALAKRDDWSEERGSLRRPDGMALAPQTLANNLKVLKREAFPK